MGHYVAQVEDVREQCVEYEESFETQQEAVDALRNRYGFSDDAEDWLRRGQIARNDWTGDGVARVFACECRMPSLLHDHNESRVNAIA